MADVDDRRPDDGDRAAGQRKPSTGPGNKDDHIVPEKRGEHVTSEVGRKAERKIEARGREERGVWFGLGMFGLIGWSVAIPTLVGVAIGWWLDRRFDDPVSWTLTLMIVGVVLGCLNAWYWMKREGRDHDE